MNDELRECDQRIVDQYAKEIAEEKERRRRRRLERDILFSKWFGHDVSYPSYRGAKVDRTFTDEVYGPSTYPKDMIVDGTVSPIPKELEA